MGQGQLSVLGADQTAVSWVASMPGQTPGRLGWLIVAVAAATAVTWAARRLPEPPDDPKKIPYSSFLAGPRVLIAHAIAAALMAAFVVWQAGQHTFLAPWLVWIACAPALAHIDQVTRRLPFLLVAPQWALLWIATGLTALIVGDSTIAVKAALGNVAVWGSFLLIHLLASRFAGAIFGYGDVRLSAGLGVLLGPLGATATFVGVYAGFLFGVVFGLIANRGRIRGASQFAFGPAMIAGAFMALCV